VGTSRADIAGTNKRYFLSLCHDDSRGLQLNSSQFFSCEDDEIGEKVADQEYCRFDADLTGTA
jgi:hypothetical protein